MRQIKIYPNEILRNKTEKVESINEELIKQANELAKMLAGNDNAAGLAAPQIGISKKFFGIKGDTKLVTVYINPKIEETFGTKEFPLIVRENRESLKGVSKKTEDFLEGCLSFPDYFGTVKRYLEIEASWMEIKDGKLLDKKGKLNGFEAIVFQHELDHINGVLFIDHVKQDNGKFFKIVDQKMVPWKLEKI